MFTYSDGIVGLWFVPVVLCILVPLAMLCGWTVIRLFKKTGNKIERIEETARAIRGESLTEKLQSQSTS